MYAQVEKPKENKNRTVVNAVVQKKADYTKGRGVIQKVSTLSHSTQNYRYKNGGMGGLQTGHFGHEMTWTYDPLDRGVRGTSPGNSPSMDMAITEVNHQLVTDSRMVRGHLLNANLGGPGVEWNMYPTTDRANKAHSQLVEEEVKDRVAIIRARGRANGDPQDQLEYTVSMEPQWGGQQGAAPGGGARAGSGQTIGMLQSTPWVDIVTSWRWREANTNAALGAAVIDRIHSRPYRNVDANPAGTDGIIGRDGNGRRNLLDPSPRSGQFQLIAHGAAWPPLFATLGFVPADPALVGGVVDTRGNPVAANPAAAGERAILSVGTGGGAGKLVFVGVVNV